MNSRRKFVFRGGLATAALLTAQPFKVLASAVTGFKNFTGTRDSLLFLHTADQTLSQYLHSRQHINTAIEKSSPVLLHAGTGPGSMHWQYDVTTDSIENNGHVHTIINRGGIKTGVVVARKGRQGICSDISGLASRLKKDGCQVVVCLSELGFKNETGPDDLALAAASKDLDIIISTNKENFPRNPVTAKNRVNGEVILQSPAAGRSGFGSIEIGFDDFGSKRRVDILTS